jgi:release factor glutamine methyltransferase
LRAAAQRLRVSGSRSPRLDAELLLAAALDVDRLWLFRRPERELTADEEERFAGFVRRREAHEPVAYIRGVRMFRTLELEVTPAVLIPRPETETLVDVALDLLAGVTSRGTPEPLVLDVGTGSGCIALALVAENPFVHVVATDVDEGALEVARRNAARHGLESRVDFALGDLTGEPPAGRRFDLVVSNPPYIPAHEYEALEPNVREYEPRLALYGGEDGLDAYRSLIPAAAACLRLGGGLAVEVGRGQAADVGALVAATGSYGPARERADLGGIPRVVHARLVRIGEGG